MPDEDTATYEVVVNHEDQYSVWLSDREIPPGWRAVGVRGPRDECLAHIERVWTDLRPRSLRRWLDEPQSDERQFDEQQFDERSA